MKANEFIKKVGWERVKHCKKPSSRDNFFIVGGEVIRDQDLIDLKRLVESHEIVNKTFKGLDDAKWWYECCWDCDSVAHITIERLKQAIVDVEICKQ